MAKTLTPLVWFDLDGEGKASPDIQGCAITLIAKVGYPGSRVSDLLIGDFKVQVPNEEIRKANLLQDEYD